MFFWLVDTSPHSNFGRLNIKMFSGRRYGNTRALVLGLGLVTPGIYLCQLIESDLLIT